jgi:hypothetical protein
VCALQAAQCSWERSTDAAAKMCAVQHVAEDCPERKPRLLLTKKDAQKDCQGRLPRKTA